MRILAKVCLGLVASAATVPAHAGSTGWGAISNYNVLARYSVILFNQAGAHSGAPSCVGSGLQQRWAFRVDTPSGQAMLQTLLSAYLAKRRIVINGTGDCSAWGDTETVSFFQVED